VICAVFGVAETGSVWLSEAQFKVSALGFLAQHLVVLLDPAVILLSSCRTCIMPIASVDPSTPHTRRRTRDAAHATLLTGPSATADIEGILIQGVQGIRSLTVLPVAT
jgi:L-lactate dehydrogenase complex protein LldG